MSKIENFKLIKEDDSTYHMSAPNGKKFQFDKSGLSEKAHNIIKKLNGDNVQNFDEGSIDVEPVDETEGEIIAEPIQDNGPAPVPAGAVSVTPVAVPDNIPKTSIISGQTYGAETPEASTAPGTSLNKSYQEQAAAQMAGASAVAQQGKEESKALEDVNKRISLLPSQNDIIQKHEGDRIKYENAVKNQKIDPDRYWHDKSTGSKISAGIGLLLGGMSAGTLGGKNPAMEVIQNGINRDIEAQKADQSKTMNLYKMNRDAMGDELSANLATQNQMLTGVKVKLEQAASKAKGPIAIAAAQNNIALIHQKIANNNAMLSLHAGLTGKAGVGSSKGTGSEEEFVNHLNTASVYAPEMAKDAQSKYIPNVGIAKVPITPEDRSELTNYDSLARGIDSAIELQNKVGKSGAWSIQNRAEAEGIKNGLMLSMGKLNDMKRPPSPEIMKLYEESIGNIGGVNFGGAIARLNDLKNQIATRNASVLDNLGVTPFRGAQNTALTPKNEYEGKVISKPGHPDLIMKDGKWVPLHGK